MVTSEVKVRDSLGNDIVLQEILAHLSYIVDRIDYGLITDNKKQLKVSLVDSGALANITTVGVVSSITALTTLTNVSRMGDVQMQRFYEAQADVAFHQGLTTHISF